jgi:hypothetical protein
MLHAFAPVAALRFQPSHPWPGRTANVVMVKLLIAFRAQPFRRSYLLSGCSADKIGC